MCESSPKARSPGTPSRPLTSNLPQLLGIPSGFQGIRSFQSRPSGTPVCPSRHPSPMHALTLQDGTSRPIHLPVTFSCPSGHKPTLSPTPRTRLVCHLLSCCYLPLPCPVLQGSMSPFTLSQTRWSPITPTCPLHLPGHQWPSSAPIQLLLTVFLSADLWADLSTAHHPPRLELLWPPRPISCVLFSILHPLPPSLFCCHPSGP